MVTCTSCGLVEHSSHTVRGGGSSIALSSTLEVRSVIRSASSTMITRHRPWDGERWATPMRSRTSSIEMVTFSVATTVTSAWVPASAVVHAGHVPQPPAGHCSAAAKARAALDRPEPGGPVMSQAWVIADGSATAPRSTATAASWPTTPSHTLMCEPPRGARPGPGPLAAISSTGAAASTTSHRCGSAAARAR